MSELMMNLTNSSPVKTISTRRSGPIKAKDFFSTQNGVVVLKIMGFILLGLLLAIASLNDHIIRNIASSYDFNLIHQTFLFSILQYLSTAVGVLLIIRTIQKPKLIFILLGFIFVVTDCVGKYGYINKTSTNIELSHVCTFLFLLALLLRSKKVLTRQSIIGLVISLVTLLLSICLLLILDSEFRFSFSDMVNILVSISIGLLSSIALYLQEKNFRSKEEIFDGLFWICISSCSFCFVTLMALNEKHIISSYFPNFKEFDYGKGLALISLKCFMLISMPFFIAKTSSLMLGLCLSSQLYWGSFVNDFFNEPKYLCGLIIFGFVVFIAGICVYLYDIVVKNIQKEKDSIYFESFPLQKKKKTNSSKANSCFNQPEYIDFGDRTSICSAFSSKDDHTSE